MPVAKIDLLEACSSEQKERLGKELIELISQTITVPRDRVRVIIHDRVDVAGGDSITFIKG